MRLVLMFGGIASISSFVASWWVNVIFPELANIQYVTSRSFGFFTFFFICLLLGSLYQHGQRDFDNKLKKAQLEKDLFIFQRGGTENN